MSKSAAKQSRKHHYQRGIQHEVLEDDDLLREILAFAPRMSYRYFGLVSNNFQRNYLEIHANDRDTSIRIALQSVSTAKIWVQENPDQRSKTRGCAIAAREGNLEVLMFLRSEGFAWSAWACAQAARGGHLDVLQWARENGCKWDTETCHAAAENGHFNVLRWAHENGCNWNATTCTGAARYGHLRVLQWAQENGCDWNPDTCLHVARRFPVIIAWITENHC